MSSKHENYVAPTPIILVGCGAVSRFFYANALRILADSGMVTVEALVDPSKANALELAKVLPAAPIVPDMKHLEFGRSHLVIIASPPRFHAEQSIYALEQGASVLCEKPMATTSLEAQAMIHAAETNQALLAIGLYKRFFPACEAIKGIIERQPLGQLIRFRIEEGGKFTWRATSDSFFRKSVTPGGVLYDIGTHTLDLLVWWLGDPVYLNYEDDRMGGVEANCRIELEFSCGCYGTVRLSRDWPTTDTYTFFFERGTVQYRVNQANHLEVNVDGMPTLIKGKLTEYSRFGDRLIEYNVAPTDPQSFVRQVVNVARSRRGEEGLRVSGEEGIRSLLLIERCYARRKLMSMPWFKPQEFSAARKLSGESTIGTEKA